MSAKCNFMAFLGGAAVGAVVAVLFAPDKGEVTRRKIGKAASDGVQRAKEAYQQGLDKVSDTYRKSRERLANALSTGREMADEELDAIRDIIAKGKKESAKGDKKTNNKK